MNTSIRQMSVEHLTAVRRLLQQLGYDIDAAEVSRRFTLVFSSDEHSLLVAERDDNVIGFIHGFLRPALEKPPEAVVQSLIVDRVERGTGAGLLLMQAFEEWSKERGFNSISLYTNISRTEAHKFYERIGYDTTATSHLMRKETSR